MYDILQLNDLILPELKGIADKLKIKNAQKMEKTALVHAILDAQALSKKEETEDKPVSEKARRPRIRKPIEKTNTPLFSVTFEDEKAETSIAEPVQEVVEKVEFEKAEPQQKAQKPERKPIRKTERPTEQREKNTAVSENTDGAETQTVQPTVEQHKQQAEEQNTTETQADQQHSENEPTNERQQRPRPGQEIFSVETDAIVGGEGVDRKSVV